MFDMHSVSAIYTATAHAAESGVGHQSSLGREEASDLQLVILTHILENVQKDLRNGNKKLLIVF